MSIWLGTDPEFFIFDKKKKSYVSASEVFGDKNHPWLAVNDPDFKKVEDGYYIIRDSNRAASKIFRDGFGVEINVLPSTCRESLFHWVSDAIHDAQYVIQRKNPNWILRSRAMVEVPLSYIETLPEDVKRFGCEPSLNAYMGGVDLSSLNGEVHPFRYAGGHMHFSMEDFPWWFDPKKEDDRHSLVRLFDLLIGLPLSLIFRKEEDEFQRRKAYGKAGEFRKQKWGVEYRTPSSRIWNHPAIASLAFGAGRNCIFNFFGWKEVWKKLKKDFPNLESDLISAINEGRGGEELVQYIPNLCDKKLVSYLSEEGKKALKLTKLSSGLVKDLKVNGLQSSLAQIGEDGRIPV